MKTSIPSAALFPSHSRCNAGLRLGLALAVAGWLLSQVSLSAQCGYSITVPPGYSMIANQCNNTNAGGNTLNNLYPGVPPGCKITKWNQAGQVFEPSAVFSGGGVWSPNFTLNPGEGAFFFNPTASTLTLTNSGATPTPNLPLALPSTGCSIVSRQQALVGGYNDIVGLPPQPGETFVRFVSGMQAYSVWFVDPFNQVWMNNVGLPEDPMANVGESVWICRGVPDVPPPPTNSLPVVNLFQPTNGAVFSVGNPILLRAQASDSDGTLTNIQFFAGRTLLRNISGTLSNGIYSFMWTNAPAGMYFLRAEATDNEGDRGVSAQVQVNVSDVNNQAPVVSWIRPTNGASFPFGTIQLTARATDADGAVSYVEFFATPTNQPSTTVNLGRVFQASSNNLYTLSWSNAPAGSFHLQAVAGDNLGARGFSPLVEIRVNPAQCNYAITAPPGFSMIANQCNNTNAGGNTLNNLYPGVPAGSKITKWNQAGQVFEPSAVFSGGVWTPNLTLNPGEGAFFENPTASAITLTSSGATPTPNLPLALPDIGCSIVSRQRALVGGYNDIVGLPPQPGEAFVRFMSGNYLIWVSDPFDLVWMNNVGVPEDPMANVGESVWVCRNALPPDNLPTNDLPVVSLFQPTNGAVFSVGTDILLRANVSDSDGLTNIQFFAGTTLLRNISGTLTNGVYIFMWSNPPAGMHFLRAEAVDSVGVRGVSAQVQVSVSAVGNVRPVVTLTRPPGGAAFGSGIPVLMTADVSVPVGSITNVEFRANATLVHRFSGLAGSTNSFSFNWTTAPIGTHLLRAVAWGNAGGVGTSAPVQITVTGTNVPPTNVVPVVNWIRPTNGASFPGGTIPLTAQATDADGSVNYVEFFATTTTQPSVTVNLGRTDPANPPTNNLFTVFWSNAPAGSFHLQAVGVDNFGARGFSALVEIMVNPAQCHYAITAPPGFSMIANQCNNTNAGGNTLNNLYPGVPAGSKITKWNQAGQVFEPSAVFSGGVWTPNLTLNPGEGAFFENPTASAITLTSSGATPTPNLPLALPTVGCSLVSRQRALVGGYNDIVGLPPQPGDAFIRLITGNYHIWASDPFSDIWVNSVGLPEEPAANLGESIWVCRGVSDIPPIPTSTNVPPTNMVPVVNWVRPSNGSNFPAGSTIQLTARATDADGTVTNVQFFATTATEPSTTVNLGRVFGPSTNNLYSLFWSNAPVGGFQLQIVADDNVGARGFSSTVLIIVNGGTNAPPPTNNVLPVVNWLRPTNGAALEPFASTLLTANATDADGTINFVEFYAGSNLLGRGTKVPTNSTYNLTWTNPPPGIFLLRAEAVDNANGRGISAPVQVTVGNIEAVDLGIVEVPAIGHQVSSNAVIDFLIDQDQSSGGGGVLQNVSVDWDTNIQFKLTVAAPPNMKFLVTLPPGAFARFGGFLWWESTRGGFSGAGRVTATFVDLEGIEPPQFTQSAHLSDSHGYFGFSGLESTAISNSFSFAAVTLTGTVALQHTGNGAEDYVPHLESALHLSYPTSEPNDPGGFIAIVPNGPLPMAVMASPPGPSGVDIMVYGRPGRTHIVECSLDTVTWTAISKHAMPPKGSMTVRDASATTKDNRFYRIVEVP